MRRPTHRIGWALAFVSAICTAGAVAGWQWWLPEWLDSRLQSALAPASPWGSLHHQGLALRPWGALIIQSPQLLASPWYGAWLGLPFGYSLSAHELRIDGLRLDRQLQLRALRLQIKGLHIPETGWTVQAGGALQALLAPVTLTDAGHAALRGDIELALTWENDLRTAHAVLDWHAEDQGRLQAQCTLDAPQQAVRDDPRNLFMRSCELGYVDAGLARDWWQAQSRERADNHTRLRGLLARALAVQEGLDTPSREALLVFLSAADDGKTRSAGTLQLSLHPPRPAPLLMRPYNGWLAALQPSLRAQRSISINR